MARTIVKRDDATQVFSERKLARSLRRAGAPVGVARDIVSTVAQDAMLKTSKEIHQKAFSLLKKKNFRPVAARYNLKKAILQLGPSGYPFEQFIAQLLAARGHKTQTNQMLSGRCLRHEVDVVAQRDDVYQVFECKFHNSFAGRSDAKVALYVKARFDDLREQWEKDAKNKERRYFSWIVTNTRFSRDAIRYAACNSIQLLAWNYPQGSTLAELIDHTGVHPVTALTNLTLKEKHMLVNNGLVLCRDVPKQKELLRASRFNDKKIKEVMAEAEAICRLKETIK